MKFDIRLVLDFTRHSSRQDDYVSPRLFGSRDRWLIEHDLSPSFYADQPLGCSSV